MPHIPNLPLMFQFCSRLCHDLAAPLGAIAMGIELLEEETPESPAVQVLKTSSVSANNRLQLVRCLFGFSSSPEVPSSSDIHAKLQQILAPKITLTWPALPPEETPYGEGARLIGALMMVASEGCPRGGALRWLPHHTLEVEGERVGLSPDHLTALLTPEKAAPRFVMTALTGYLVQSLGAELRYTQHHEHAFSLEVL